ncbi:unnamed protein product [Ascophyllum nodosum]
MPYSEEDFFDAIGFLGAVILATALLPQIYRVHIRRSAKDISYGWQAVYFTGLVLLLTYYWYYEKWAVVYPMGVELPCILYLTALKIYFERVVPRQPGPGAASAEERPLLHETRLADRTL